MNNRKRASKGSKTAAEHLAELEKDPEYLESIAKQDADRAAREVVLREAQRPLIADLSRAGVPVSSVWDLVNASYRYEQVIPVLVEHLRKDYPESVIEGIGRALAVPYAENAFGALVEAFQAAKSNRVRTGIACALEVTGRKAHGEQLLQLVRDKHFGEARIILLDAFRDKPDILRELSDDPQLVREITAMLERHGGR